MAKTVLNQGIIRDSRIPVWARARMHTAEALACLASVMKDETAPPGVRIVAADKLLDRAWGRAPQVIVGDDTRPVRVEVSHLGAGQLAQLESLLMAALGESVSQSLGQSGIGPRPAPLLSSPSPYSAVGDDPSASGDTLDLEAITLEDASSDGEDNRGDESE